MTAATGQTAKMMRRYEKRGYDFGTDEEEPPAKQSVSQQKQ